MTTTVTASISEKLRSYEASKAAAEHDERVRAGLATPGPAPTTPPAPPAPPAEPEAPAPPRSVIEAISQKRVAHEERVAAEAAARPPAPVPDPPIPTADEMGMGARGAPSSGPTLAEQLADAHARGDRRAIDALTRSILRAKLARHEAQHNGGPPPPELAALPTSAYGDVPWPGQ
jgi:hypothetical protein